MPSSCPWMASSDQMSIRAIVSDLSQQRVSIVPNKLLFWYVNKDCEKMYAPCQLKHVLPKEGNPKLYPQCTTHDIDSDAFVTSRSGCIWIQKRCNNGWPNIMIPHRSAFKITEFGVSTVYAEMDSCIWTVPLLEPWLAKLETTCIICCSKDDIASIACCIPMSKNIEIINIDKSKALTILRLYIKISYMDDIKKNMTWEVFHMKREILWEFPVQPGLIWSLYCSFHTTYFFIIQ